MTCATTINVLIYIEFVKLKNCFACPECKRNVLDSILNLVAQSISNEVLQVHIKHFKTFFENFNLNSKV